jgi:hypothetical protein
LNEAAVVFASEAAAAAAAGGLIRRGKVLSLTAACQGQQLAGPIVVVEPATVDVSAPPPLRACGDALAAAWHVVLLAS